MRLFVAAALLSLLALSPTAARAGEVHVAVAANFTAPMQRIATAFEQDTGHKAMLVFGSTGKFHAQIINGAPFDMLLAADENTPARLERDGQGVAGTRFTYATGRLVLWSAQPGLVDDNGDVLARGTFEHIALADPKLAPYGTAAVDAMTRLGVLQRLQPRFVQGENIAQTYQFISTGNAALGFVALSQVMRDGSVGPGSAWLVPTTLHAPLRQDAIVLVRGKGNAAAKALMAYMHGDKARAVIRSYGYEL